MGCAASSDVAATSRAASTTAVVACRDDASNRCSDETSSPLLVPRKQQQQNTVATVHDPSAPPPPSDAAVVVGVVVAASSLCVPPLPVVGPNERLILGAGGAFIAVPIDPLEILKPNPFREGPRPMPASQNATDGSVTASMADLSKPVFCSSSSNNDTDARTQLRASVVVVD
jgi:hypothetical protein